MLESPVIPRQFNHFQLLISIPCSIAFMFICIALLTLSHVHKFLFIDNIHGALGSIKAETYLELMGWENPYYNKELPDEYVHIHFSQMMLQTVTNINFRDERSLLGNELPGFSIFDTKIIIAGEGTNYTNVPIESPPPPDYVIKEHEKRDTSPSKQLATHPQVFFYNTHSWESYLPLLGKAGAKNVNLASTQDQSKNVHLVDQLIIDGLANSGVEAVQDKNIVTDYNAAYSISRKFIKAAIVSKNHYQLFLDIHRDSLRKENTTTMLKGKNYARVSFIVGAANPDAEKNKTIAQDIHNKLTKSYPGVSKGVFEKTRSEGNGVYNQDLSSHALLIEVGGVDNTLEELRRTANALANVISEYVKQADKV